MDLSQYKYRALFEAKASLAPLSQGDMMIAKASLDPLKNLLPAGIDPEDSPDLLYISFDGALGGYINRNGDGITSETAVAIYQTAKHKFIDVEHDRDRIIGVILYPALTERDSHKTLTDQEALSLGTPFNMSFAGVIWRAVSPLITKYIQQQGSSTDKDVLSTSWEVLFNDYNIAVGDLDLNKAALVTPDNPSFAVYDKMLRCNGGKGLDEKNQPISRVITGDAILGGFGIVANPAAAVKGILPVEKIVDPATTQKASAEWCPLETKSSITLSEGEYDAVRFGYTVKIGDAAIETKDGIRSPENAPIHIKALIQDGRLFWRYADEATVTPASSVYDIQIPQAQIDALARSVKEAILAELGELKVKPAETIAADSTKETMLQKSEEKNTNPSNVSVNPNTAPSMKIESIEQLQTALASHEASAAVVDFVKAIQDASVKFSQELKAKEDLVKNAELAKAENEKRANELQASLDEVKKELSEVKAAQETTEANQRFQERMASFDERFDLDDEDRKLIASDIKDLDDDAFAAYSKKQDKLMCAKSKAAKKDNKKADKKDGEKPGDKSDDKEPDNDDDDAKAAKAALASVTPTDDSKLPNTVVVDQTLASQIESAFANSFKIDGQTVAERKAARAKKK